MLGKRARGPMKRTTSMSGMSFDGGNLEDPRPLDPQNPISNIEDMALGGPSGYDRSSSAILSPRYYKRESADHQRLETAHFLRICGLCNRRLAPGRDIYMYRGDTAFCSQECREQQMKHDEKKEKGTMAVSKKVESHHNHSELATAASEASSNGETIAAA